MHQHKTIAQTLLVLSILNLVAAIPIVPQVLDTGNDDLDAVEEDVTTVSEMRRGAEQPAENTMTPGQYLQTPQDGLPPHNSLPLSGLPPSSNSEMVRVPTSEHPLSATDRPAPVPDSNTGASTSAHPLSADDPDYYKLPYGLSSDASVEEIKNAYKKMAMNWPKTNPAVPAPAPESIPAVSTPSQRPVPQSVSTATAEGSTPHYTVITHDMLGKGPDKYARLKQAGGLLFMGSFVGAIVFLSAWHNNKSSSNSTGG